VDQEGSVLDILVTSRRDAKAATRFFRKLLKGLRYVPRVLVTDKLASYGVAHRRLIPGSGAPPLEVPQQSRRELPSAHPGAGTSDAALPLPGRCAAVPVRVLRDLPALPTPPPPAYRQGIPPRDADPIHRLERDHRHDHGSRLKGHTRDRPAPIQVLHAHRQPEARQVDSAVHAAYALHRDDDFGQAGTLVREVLDDPARERLVSNVAGHLFDGVTEPVLQRAFEYWKNIDKDTGDKIEKAVRQGAGVSTGH